MATYKVPVSINHPGAGGMAWNIWHLRVEDEVDFGDAMDALDDFYTTVKGLYPNGTQVTVGDGIIKNPYTAPEYFTYTPTVVTGTGQTAQAPQLLAIVVSWRTASATRSGRGRTFLGPLELSALDVDGTPKAAYLSEVQAAATALVAASTGVGGWAFGVYSHKQSVLRDFVGWSVKDRCSYLSSRRD